MTVMITTGMIGGCFYEILIVGAVIKRMLRKKYKKEVTAQLPFIVFVSMIAGRIRRICSMWDDRHEAAYKLFIEYLFQLAQEGVVLPDVSELVDNFAVNGEVILYSDYELCRDGGESRKEWWSRITEEALCYNKKCAIVHL
jgi:hypothetical protein